MVRFLQVIFFLKVVLIVAVTVARAPGEEHWSFRALRDPPAPRVKHRQAIANAIDAHVVSALEEKGLAPSPRAGRVTLIRRLHLNLLGLPPSPAKIARIAADDRPDWYERLVDDLLASPRYGERWARHWLDLVRYAESHGYETNRPRPNAYHYRDYVIGAFNHDLPYHRFVLEQLAGDAVGVDAATGFLVAGPHDVVKSPDIELTRMQRSDELADFVNATSTTFLGLTVACARCHDHKFDPITQTDYYAMVAVLAGVKHGERPLRRSPAAEEKGKLARLTREIAAVRQSLSAIPVREPVNPRRNVEFLEPVTAKLVRFTVLATNRGEPCIDELEIWSAAGAGEAPENVALASNGARPSASGTLPGYEIHRLEHINDGRYGNGRSWISNTSGGGWVAVELARPTPIERIVWGRDRERKFSDRVATRYRIEVAARADGGWRVVSSSADRLPPDLELGALPERLPRLSAAQSREARTLLARLGSLEAEREKLAEATKRRAQVWAGTFDQPGPTHRLHRGDPSAPQEVVGPDGLAAFGSLGLAVDAPERERRVALARWIGSAENPLTARVLVNRIWQHHFGNGLVTTPSDFGRNGAAPSHPALLDFLARELIRGGWSIKHIQRLLVLSSTFQQSSAPRPAALAVDADNRLLWRFVPRRLEAEAMRDSILLAAGVLDLRMGGPGFEVVVAQKGNVYNYDTKTSFLPSEWRRMVYGHHIRGEQDGTFGAFDWPDGGQVTPRRSRSTTALQALNLLNGPFVLEQAGILATRLEREAGADSRAQVRRAFALLFGRAPDAGELAGAVALVDGHGLPALCRALFNSNEFLFVE